MEPTQDVLWRVEQSTALVKMHLIRDLVLKICKSLKSSCLISEYFWAKLPASSHPMRVHLARLLGEINPSICKNGIPILQCNFNLQSINCYSLSDPACAFLFIWFIDICKLQCCWQSKCQWHENVRLDKTEQTTLWNVLPNAFTQDEFN